MFRTGFLIGAALATAASLFWSRDARGHETLTTTVLFDREVVRILNRRCVMCHLDGGLAFPLETYEQTWLQRRPIRTAALARHMPPWAAVPGYGQFANDNNLTLRETQFLVSWVEGMGPRNAGRVFLNVIDPAQRPRNDVRATPRQTDWSLGTPSVTRALPVNVIAAEQPAFVRRVVVDLGLASQRLVRALEYQPGDRRVVRAVFLTLEKTGEWLGSWTPWYGSFTLPHGVAYRLPAGSRMVAEIHYVGAKERAEDRGAVGLYYADRPSTKTAAGLVLEASGSLPAHARAHRFRDEAVLSTDTYVVALRPEVTTGIKTIEVSARRPNGGTEVLLYAKDIPLEWPTPYIFKEPVLLPAGSRLIVTAYYQNPSASGRTAGIRLTASRYAK